MEIRLAAIESDIRHIRSDLRTQLLEGIGLAGFLLAGMGAGYGSLSGRINQISDNQAIAADRLDAKVDKLEAKIDRRLEIMDEKNDRRFESFDQKFDTVIGQLAILQSRRK